MREQVSLAVVGVDHPNKRGPARRFGIELCQPGDPVTLRREPNNKFDEYAIAVDGPEGIQLGYVRSERAAWLAPQLDRGRETKAIFQQSTPYGCAIRVAFDGTEPVLPPAAAHRLDEPDWWPDPEPPEDFS